MSPGTWLATPYVGRWTGLRAFAALTAAGFAVSVIATVLLRANDSGASVGFLFICTINAVPPPDFPGVLTTFAFEPIPTFLILAAAAGYLFLIVNVRRAGHARLASRWRVVSFMAGAALILLTVFGPLAAFSRTFLTAHMVQHFILISIAPPLLLAGAPLTLLLVAAGPRRREHWLYPVLHARWFHAMTNPVVGVALFVIIPIAWYTTPLFRLSLSNDWLHYAGYALFLLAGIHYWWPVVGANPTHWNLPHPIRVLYLFALVPIHAFLGSLFYEPSKVLFDTLQTAPRSWGPSPLLDQQIAGAMMFIVGEMLGLIATLIAAVQWSRADDREGRRYDARRARERKQESEHGA